MTDKNKPNELEQAMEILAAQSSARRAEPSVTEATNERALDKTVVEPSKFVLGFWIEDGCIEFTKGDFSTLKDGTYHVVTAPVLASPAVSQQAAPDDVIAAAWSVVQDAIDSRRAEVHPCDRDNNDLAVRACSLEIQALHAALKAAPAVSQKDGASVECSDTACIRCVTGEGWCRNEPDNPYAALSWDQDEDPAATTTSACKVCNGTRCVYGVIGDPPEECEACADQQPAEATTAGASIADDPEFYGMLRDYRLLPCTGPERYHAIVAHVDKWAKRRATAPSRDAALLAPKAIEDIADELEAEAMNYEGDFADTVNGCVEALRELVSPAATTASASPPVVPDDLVAAIRIYGDYRADSHPAASAQFGEIIKAIRVWAAALARAPLPAKDRELADVLRDMLAIQEACGLHTDEYAPGSVIEYIKEMEGESVAAPAQAGDARDAALFRKVVELGIQLHFEGGDGEDDAVWVNCLMKWADGDRLGATRELVEQEAKNLAAMSAPQGQKGGVA